MTDRIDVVLVNNDRVTLRAGDVFLKVDADHARSEREAQAMALAPVRTPDVLWRNAGVLALSALPGRAIRGDDSPAAWAAAGAALRALHDAPAPPWPGKSTEERRARLTTDSAWLVANDIVPAAVVASNQRRAAAALSPSPPVFIHGDIHAQHVLVDGDEVTGFIDWSEGAPGDALFDVASLTLAHPEHLDDLVAGYGVEVDRDRVRAWWSWRCLVVVRFLVENGYGAPESFPEVQVLHRLA